jgi:NADH-quinone oxidoreductase subunit L
VKALYLIVPLAPLVGAIVAGLFGGLIGRRGAHWVTIVGMTVSFLASLLIFEEVRAGQPFSGALYTWISTSGGLSFDIGFLIDPLSALMMVAVNFVSLMVHIYTIGYMRDDPGYTRFFSYISLFTFSMLMLVMSNNFLQLFFGWEAVGLVSYLLIGFWYTRPTAIFASLKAFLVNRVGDFGFLLGIALIYAYAGSLEYAQVFAQASALAQQTIQIFPGAQWSLLTVICVLLFIGAMGKSAQFPLHVWLPDSMEGPTPISALIHAATMVTAGIFMVARMSLLFEHSAAALSLVLVVGAITTFFMGLVAVVQNDIKRVVAYSTLSQLGYMAVGLGASAYAASIFHLMTHACFKALLFLAAGSVIIAVHHNQDMRRMGGLYKYMPVTYVTALIGSLALCGLPPFAGFYSKDSLIEATQLSTTPGAGIAYVSVLISVFVTALYTFRMMFMTFHGEERFRAHADDEGHVANGHDHGDGHEQGDGHGGTPRESPLVVTIPLVLLAIPSVYAGWAYIQPLLYGGFFGDSIVVLPPHTGLAELGKEFHGALEMVVHAPSTLPFWFAVAGVVTAWYLYHRRPELPALIAARIKPVYTVLLNKYYFDEAYQVLFADGARRLGTGLWKFGDLAVIDGFFVNGAARVVGWASAIIRRFQSGFIYHYAFMMIIGVFVLLSLWLARVPL